jgi:putative flavoprotein involved in K+ transport
MWVDGLVHLGQGEREMNSSVSGHHDVIVIGGGQAGLATGFHLARTGLDFVVLDAEHRTGEAWRRRWDSLRLFTPARHDGLPGMPFPAKPGAFPTKDEVADYLVEYVQRFKLPVRHGTKVVRMGQVDRGFEVITPDGTLVADAVVVATGTNPIPRVPTFAQTIDPGVFQIHSSEYLSPDRIPEGTVLVVGFGTSGAEIAEELAHAGRTVTISGEPTFHIPDPLLAVGGGLYWQILHNVLTRRSLIGRKVARKALGHGAPLIRISQRRVRAAGVQPVPRITEVASGRPVLADGSRADPDVIVWCTGFQPDYSWIDLSGLELNEHGWPKVTLGVADGVRGLAFVGIPFQVGLTSSLLGGVGRDSAMVVEQLIRLSIGEPAVTG